MWGSLLEEWALSGSRREKRVMQLPPAKDAFVMDESISSDENRSDKQGKITPGKIVNNNATPKPPGRQVSETDLYLLGAIEKLVYRVDFMEKRLRRVEEMLYFVMAGNRIDHGKFIAISLEFSTNILKFPEPCPNNFTRVGPNCYLFYGSAGREYDWKAASKQCKRAGAVLAELETIEENQDIIAYIQSNPHFRGKDFWTGGLNPGLLWIWSNSARPVATAGNTNKNPSSGILGEGRCLRLAYDPALRSYNYKGTDCSIRYSYICEIQENSSSNEIRRLGKSRKILDEL
ncbi:uncharacterized protein BDFB_012988 [Asbolus verrucosus]|uniref:C-type lectin domain-containing protein n=1 Tax=Asbolus verrucosus TaxID=1661398 RepID=A0A482VU32_ASBVE|nr:uncharacterized protein BDFB_012988 [Asbolus verrucosus]